MKALFFLFFLLSAQCSKIPTHHQVLIIGAGISGLRASQILTEEGIPHIIIQSKNHIGGRITPIFFEQTIVDLGSSFYQGTNNNSSFIQAINALKWPTQSSSNEYKHLFFSSKKNKLDQKEMLKVYQLQKQYSQKIDKMMNSMKTDMPISKALKDIQQAKKPQKIKNMVSHIFETKASLQGSELSKLSAKNWVSSRKTQTLQPVGGMYKLLQKWYRPKMDILHLNERVLSIDFYQQFIKIKTNKGLHRAKRVISSLPLGVMKSKKVKFFPSLPQKYEEAFNNIGNGISNKLYASFGKRFWGSKKGWLNFISTNQEAYTTAYIQPNQQKNILIFYLSQKDSLEISKLTHQQIKKDLKKTLVQFFDQTDIEIHKVLLSKWHLDEDALGSLSNFKVGTTKADFVQLSKPINKKLWFVGQHTSPSQNGCVNGAYESGQRAAKEIVRLYQIKVFLQYIPAFGTYKTSVYKKDMSSGELKKMIRMHQFSPVS